eukprot:TRINITY_DN455_c3_g1_i1.p1 TRINITY_DN455_c3_g1~~TRINITY_DN455_c3_g1_i1.p1  ORF type:complete len:299 (-),score=83.19 TRINITY_DN455_c3_g1_i1:54-950(-)
MYFDAAANEQPAQIDHSGQLSLARAPTTVCTVSLRRNTIETVVRNGLKHVAFAIDCVVPVKVSLLYSVPNAAFDGRGSSLDVLRRLAAAQSEPVKVEAATNKRVELALLDSSTMHAMLSNVVGGGVIDVDEAMLSEWPLVIVAEAESGPVRVQTTCCNLLPLDDNDLVVKAIEQRVEHKGRWFTLNELFGAVQSNSDRGDASASSSSSSTSSSGASTTTSCVVCLSSRRRVAVLPCRHLSLCDECASELRKRTNRCPICRGVAIALLRIELTRDKNDNDFDDESTTTTDLPDSPLLAH